MNVNMEAISAVIRVTTLKAASDVHVPVDCDYPKTNKHATMLMSAPTMKKFVVA